jgi:Glycosyltransferase family 87
MQPDIMPKVNSGDVETSAVSKTSESLKSGQFTYMTKSPINWLAAACGLWCFLCLVLLVRSGIWPTRQTVHLNFSRAGQHWIQGTDAYELKYDGLGNVVPKQMGGYRYSPLFAAVFAPLSMLPDPWCGTVWRLINYLSYIAALFYFFRQVVPGTKTLTNFQQAVWWVLLIPLSLPSMNNGQANVLMMAFLLAAATAVIREHWNLAALALAGAFYLKLYPVAIAMLLVLVYPKQLGWRFALAVLAGFLLPFILQNPSYVWSQYEAWYWLLKVDSRDEFEMSLAYRDFYLLTRCVGRPMSPELYQSLQLAAAGFVAAVGVLGRWARWPKQTIVHSLLLLGCCWLILFGPATESCTYILLAPGTAWALVDAFVFRRSLWTRMILVLVFGLCLTNSIANWFPDARLWCFPLLPLAALLFFLERGQHVCFAWQLDAPQSRDDGATYEQNNRSCDQHAAARILAADERLVAARIR